jgi:hypothetical protein
MRSLFDELDEKVRREPSLRKQNMPRVDMSLLLFNARDDVRALWMAAHDAVDAARAEGRAPPDALVAAVDKLRPIFGERATSA